MNASCRLSDRRKPFGQMTKQPGYLLYRFPIPGYNIYRTWFRRSCCRRLSSLIFLTFISGSAVCPFLYIFHYRFPGFVPRHHRSGFIRCKGRPLRLIRQLEVHFLQNFSFLRKSYWSLGKDHSNVLNLFCNSLNRSIISSKEGALV